MSIKVNNGAGFIDLVIGETLYQFDIFTKKLVEWVVISANIDGGLVSITLSNDNEDSQLKFSADWLADGKEKVFADHDLHLTADLAIHECIDVCQNWIADIIKKIEVARSLLSTTKPEPELPKEIFLIKINEGYNRGFAVCKFILTESNDGRAIYKNQRNNFDQRFMNNGRLNNPEIGRTYYEEYFLTEEAAIAFVQSGFSK